LVDSEDSDCGGTSPKSSLHKDRFFGFNAQSKSPKDQRFFSKYKLKDPHYLNEVTDPVFSLNCLIQGIQHR